VAALSALSASGRVAAPGALLVGGRYAHQRRLATELGATAALTEEQLARAVRRRSGSLSMADPHPGRATGALTGGADVVFDCVGSADSIGQSLDIVRPRGRVVLVGMPGRVHVDLAPLWQREVHLVGAYAYGTETLTGPRERVRTFDLAFEVVAAHRLGRLVSAVYPIERFEEAVQHAGSAGRRGAVKVAFDLRRGAERGGDRRDRGIADEPSTTTGPPGRSSAGGTP
jgi:threonine dehydrogenase-like Zn-dependent dehydrogenase